MSARLAAGRGPWASPRRWTILVGALALVAIALTALAVTRGPATSGAPGAARDEAASAGAAAGAAGASAGPAGQVIGAVPGFPTSVGGVRLVAAQYAATEVLAKPGAQLMSTLLSALGASPTEVKLIAAVDLHQRLSIGVWEIPGRTASSLVDGWKRAAVGSWEGASIGGQSVLVGTDAATSRPAYVTARDGRLIYIVTAERPLAEAALAALR